MRIEIALKLLIVGVAVGFAVLHLLLYLFYRRARANFFFSLFAFGAAARILSADVLSEGSSTATGVLYVVSQTSLAFAVFAFGGYLHTVFSRPVDRYYLIIAALWLVLIVWEAFFGQSLGYSPAVFLIGCFAVFELFRTLNWFWKANSDGVWIIGVGLVLLAFSPIKDLVGDLMKIDFSETIDTGVQQISMYGIILANSLFLARSFAHTNFDLEKQIEQVKELSAREIEHVRANAELKLLNEQERARRALVEQELELAASIQEALFPGELPAPQNFDIAARSLPARECGGDYYDVLKTKEETFLFCVADVAGKGLPAALLMSNMQATLRALANETDSLAELAARISYLLYEASPANKFVTAIFVEINIHTALCRYVNAGHNECVLMKKATGGESLILKSTGLPLGMLPGFSYEENCFEMQVGDSLVLYSDGVPEARNVEEEEWGETNLFTCLQEVKVRSAREIVESVLSEINLFSKGAPQHDDITLLVVRRVSEKRV